MWQKAGGRGHSGPARACINQKDIKYCGDQHREFKKRQKQDMIDCLLAPVMLCSPKEESGHYLPHFEPISIET